MNLKSLFVIACCTQSILCQEYVQRFNVDEILDSDSELNYILSDKVKGVMNNEKNQLALFRFDDDKRFTLFILLRKREDPPRDPFTETEDESKFTCEIAYGNIQSLRNGEEITWKDFKDKTLIEDCKKCSFDQSNQERNFLAMKALHDESYMYVFVKDRGTYYGGKIIKPVKDTKTAKLMQRVDKFFEDHPVKQPYDK